MARTSRLIPFLLLPLVIGACSGPNTSPAETGDSEPSPLLYVWAADVDAAEGDSDFLMVIDVDPESATYGSVISSAPVGSAGNDPHHAEPVAPRDGLLFANGFEGNRTFLFDLSDPMAPRMERELPAIDGYSYVHSFLRLSSGDVLATVQHGDGRSEDDVGGLARFSPRGELIQVSSAVDVEAGFPAVRPYALQTFEEQDRVVTSSFAMSLERSANVVQVWRLSDLELLATVGLPELAPASEPLCHIDEFAMGEDCSPDRIGGHDRPFEVRALSDGSAILNTVACGFYRVSDLTSDPRVEALLNWSEEVGCMIPTIVGDHYVIPNMFMNYIATLDVSDPTRLTEVTRAPVEDGTMPHWMQVDEGTNRVVLSGGTGEAPMLRMYEVDAETGALVLDEAFAEAFDMARTDWPHGPTGLAMPHAALFGKR